MFAVSALVWKFKTELTTTRERDCWLKNCRRQVEESVGDRQGGSLEYQVVQTKCAGHAHSNLTPQCLVPQLCKLRVASYRRPNRTKVFLGLENGVSRLGG